MGLSEDQGFLLPHYSPLNLWARASAASHPPSLSFWFILPDSSAAASVNPDCEESGESSSSGGSEPEPSRCQLFCLEYEADSGEVTSVIVYQVRLMETAAAKRPWAVVEITARA